MRHSRSTASYKAANKDPTLRGHTVSGATQIYISLWIKGSEAVGGSSKLMRLNGASYHENSGRQTMSWDPPVGLYAYDNGYCNTPTDGGPTLGSGNWHHIEGWFDQASSKTMKTWVDGVAEANISTSSCGNWNWDYVWLIGVDRNDAGVPQPTIWMDDVYIDNTPQRVMVCAGSSWANRGHCEIQIPQNTWADSAIEVKANQGAFTDSSTNYLYVVDAAGAANSSGLEITFGESETPTPTGSLSAGVSAAGVTFR